MSLQSIITEKTLIPVSLVLTIMGGVSWLTSMSYKIEANRHNIETIQQDNKNVILLLNSIDKRLLEIEITLKLKKGENNE